MKRLYFYLSTLFCLFALGLSTVACSEDDEFGANEGLTIKVYSPTKVIPGQEVVISGTGLDFVTSVIFPGDVSATSVEVINAGMIKVVTPAGIDANGGELVVKTADESVTAHIPMTIGNPKINIVNPSDKASIGDELTITGTDMEFFTKAYFPLGEGEEPLVVNAIDFNRKSTSQLRLSVPRGIVSGPAAIRLETCDGKQYTLPEIELDATVPGRWETVTTTIWEGPKEISWSDDGKVILPYEVFQNVVAGDIMTIHFDQIDQTWGQAQFNYATWQSFVFEEFGAGAQVLVPTDVFGWEFASREMPLVMTQEILDNIHATHAEVFGVDAGIIIQGQSLIFTKVTISQEVFIEGEAGGPTTIVGWEGEQEVSWGDDAGKIPVPYSIFENIPVGAVLNIEYNQIDQTWGCLQLNDASWTQLPFAELGGQGQLTPTDLYGWEFSSRSTPLVLTKEILDQIHAKHGDVFGVDAGMVIQGQAVVLTKVSVTYETAGGGGAAETVIWEGEADLGSWSLNYEVKPNTAFIDAGVAAGMSMKIYADAYAEGAKIQLFNGHWERLFADVELLIPEDGVVTVPIDETLAGYLTEYIDWGYCLIVQGQDCVLKKITIF